MADPVDLQTLETAVLDPVQEQDCRPGPRRVVVAGDVEPEQPRAVRMREREGQEAGGHPTIESDAQACPRENCGSESRSSLFETA